MEIQPKSLGNVISDVETGNDQEQELRKLTEELVRLLEKPQWINLDKANLLQKRIHTCLENFRSTANKTECVSKECFAMAEKLEKGSQRLSFEVKKLDSHDNSITVCLCILTILSVVLPIAYFWEDSQA